MSGVTTENKIRNKYVEYSIRVASIECLDWDGLGILVY